MNVNRNQWIRSPVKSGRNSDEQAESIPKNNLGKNVVDGPDEVLIGSNSIKEKEVLTFPKVSHSIMMKNGQHQLVLSSKMKIRSLASASATGDSSSENEKRSLQSATKSQTLTREGTNKLVSLNASSVSKATEQRQVPSMNLYSKAFQRNGFRTHKNNFSSTSGAIEKRSKTAPPSTLMRSTVKRIKLSAQPSKDKAKDSIAYDKLKEGSDYVSQSSLLSSQHAAGKDTNSKATPTEKYSDFAYREISRVRQRPLLSRHNLHWSKKTDSESRDNTHSGKTPVPSPTFVDNPDNRPKTKNMGLVRIQPDEKNTPICPNFLRGLHCQNQYCRKRHDIPKEFALPVCSFFQRHGQCLRGETCVFRHVKVNAKALVCPSFAILGFCEDEKCSMQHIRTKKGADASIANGICTIATEESSSRFRRKRKNVYYRKQSTSGDGA